jgi:polysaccharide export outer membrane protein
MLNKTHVPAKGLLWLLLVFCGTNSGCRVLHREPLVPEVPTERAKATLPPYVIEPPDVLHINVLRLVPQPPYKLAPFDEVGIRFPAVSENMKKADLEDLAKTGRIIVGTFTVEPEGTVNLGPNFGRVNVADLTVDQARAVVEAHLKKKVAAKYIEDGGVFFELTQFRGMELIRGDHLVRPDGTISLGTYGSVPVAGLDLDTARSVIEQHLETYIKKPQVSLDISGFNSMVYYVIFDGAGNGEQVFRFPIYGKETVLDAIAQVNGLPPVASLKRIYISRPALLEGEEEIVLPVDWRGITRRGATASNYQIFPGDRLYVQAIPVVCTTTWLERIIAPMEKVLGSSLLGVSAYSTFRFLRQNQGINNQLGTGGVGGTGF